MRRPTLTVDQLLSEDNHPFCDKCYLFHTGDCADGEPHGEVDEDATFDPEEFPT